MSNTEHPAGGAHRSFRCTFGPVREVDLVRPPVDELVQPVVEDLVWPPADEDIEACSFVQLDGGDAQPARIEASGIEAAGEPPPVEAAGTESHRPEPHRPELIRLKPRRIKPTFGDCRARGAAPRVRPLIVPMEPAPLPGPALPEAPSVTPLPAVAEEARVADLPAQDTPAAAADALPPPLPFPALPSEPETAGARRSAWVAVFFAAACALATFAEYRAIPEEPPVPGQVSVADVPVPAPMPRAKPSSPAPKQAAPRQAAASPTAPIPAPTVKLAPPPAPATPPRPAPEPRLAVATPRRDAEPVRAIPPRVTVDVRDRGIVPAGKVEPRVSPPAARPEPPPALAARVEAPPPAPAPTLTPTPAPVAAAAKPEPLAKAAPSTPVPAALSDAANDEAGIQTTLTRFRTAYSQLDASAARDVWPSVDARALERAFQSLKSQDLRFDSCTMTVTGARAQAACKGRAVYVPRIGDQSPRFSAREWNFELRKADERWTIASARSL
jgi:hypothetical protein